VGGRPHRPFRFIDRLRRGDRIIVRTDWGRYVYRVTRTEIVTPRAWAFFENRGGRERLTIAACSNKDGEPGYASHRYVVVARLAR